MGFSNDLHIILISVFEWGRGACYEFGVFQITLSNVLNSFKAQIFYFIFLTTQHQKIILSLIINEFFIPSFLSILQFILTRLQITIFAALL